MRVVVIGGGIIGLSIAYQLQTRNVDVTVIEKSRIGAGATDRAAGGIRSQFTTPVSIQLSQHSKAIWNQFSHDFGVDIGFQQPGYLYLARDETTLEQFQTVMDEHRTHDVPSKLLEPEEITTRWPQINTDNYVGGTYCPTDGYADPHLALQGYYEAACEEGVDCKIGAPVVDIRTDGDRVVGVHTPEAAINSDFVVNAAGAWANQIGQLAGVDLPVVPKRRQVILVNPETAMDTTVPFTTDLDAGMYFRPDGDGTALLGGHFQDSDTRVDPDEYRQSVEQDWMASALEHARDVASVFGGASRILDGWAGLYAMTPDQHPIIDEPRPGFVTAVGFSGHGFMQAPATGIVVSQLILTGAASLVDISRLRLERFEDKNLLDEIFYSA